MPLALFIFLKIAFVVPLKFQDCSITMKNAIRILIGIALNLYIVLDSMDILTILLPIINEHGLSIYLYSSVSFINML